MTNLKLLFAFLFLALTALPMSAQGKAKSTITFGRTESLSSDPANKRTFKKDIEAVSKSHDSWKKAHLNSVLYACQKNSERVAILARQVADKLELAKHDATKDASAVQKLLSETLANETEIPALLSAEDTANLHASLKLLSVAKKRGQILEHLTSQVMDFYIRDIPRASANGGECRSAYAGALNKGVAASKRYHSDALALSQKIESLSKQAEAALSNKIKMEMVAAASR